MASPYPRPDAPGEFLADKVIGIILIVLSVLGVLCGIFIAAGASFLGVGALSAGKEEAIAGSALAGLAAMGFITIIWSAVGIAIGYGIMKGLRWGFLVGMIRWGISVFFAVLGFNVLGFLIDSALCAYCFLRLMGRLGPPVP